MCSKDFMQNKATSMFFDQLPTGFIKKGFPIAIGTVELLECNSSYVEG